MAIIQKCQAEGLDIKNHMSTLSAGLEATIREWFSVQEHGTAVETAAPVDLKKVKTRKPRKTASKEEKPEVAEIDEVDSSPVLVEGDSVEEAATMEGPALALIAAEAEADTVDTPLAKERQVHRHKRKSPAELAHQEEPQSQTAEEAPAPTNVGPSLMAPVAEVKAADPAWHTPLEEVKPLEAPTPLRMIKLAPEVKVKPTAYVPKPAQMQGPKVVRMERPEPVAPPRPRRGGPVRDFVPGREPIVPPSPETAAAAAARKGRKDRKTATPEETEEAAKKSKLRTQRRRGRGSEPVLLGPHEWGDRDLQELQERLASASAGKLHGKERRLARDETPSPHAPVAPRHIDKVTIKEPVLIKNLSEAIGVRVSDILTKLMQNGVMATINRSLDNDVAIMIALEFGVELTVESKRTELQELQEEFDKLESTLPLEPRPPVVAFLGHVDHGKTSLLDYIRKATVASGESGGITQHIGSYLYDDGKRQVAFLDTPGHRAFTAMRSRGANMTDVVVLVVAADDGVMPQTEEALSHAKAAGVPIVVALNKTDLPNVDINRALGQLADKGLIPAEWGGTVEVVRTSAVTGKGVDDLVEHLDYVAELNQLKARKEGPATGWVVEAEITPHAGVVARLLVKTGTMKVGDMVVSGSSYGRIRKMTDTSGRALKEAGPATPLELSGLDMVPVAGDRFYVVNDVTRAKRIAEEQKTQRREKTLSQRRQVTLENLFSEISSGLIKELNVILKADVQGSIDVLKNTLMELNTQEVAVKILHAAVGGISESDVLLAEASNAVVVGFHVVADDRARDMADTRGVEIRLYQIIYQITEDIRKALEGMLAPSKQEKQLGRIEVRQVFRISRIGTIAGCYVTEGLVNRSAKLRLIRDNMVIRDESAIETLRRNKDDVSEVRAGFECGIKIAGFDDIKEGDRFDAFEMVTVTRKLPPATAPGR